MENVDTSIEQLRDRLNYLISTEADYTQILEVSIRLDKLIALYYENMSVTYAAQYAN